MIIARTNGDDDDDLARHWWQEQRSSKLPVQNCGADAVWKSMWSLYNAYPLEPSIHQDATDHHTEQFNKTSSNTRAHTFYCAHV